jgi:aminopeptidase YwaD
MDVTWIKSRIAAHVVALADEIGPRPAGSPANRLATDYLRMVLAATELEIRAQPFTCSWWEPGSATLRIGGAWVDAPPSPFSRPCDVHGRVTRLGTAAELAAVDGTLEPGRVIVLHGDLTAESYMPRGFPFLDLPEQRAILDRVEALAPAAVVAVVPVWRAVPVLEDGGLGFPYLAVPTNIGDRLREHRDVGVRIGGAIHDGGGENVAARHGPDGPRTVLTAHVDTKVGTPGAFDNAGGVATLLALAEWGLPDGQPVEFVFFNGEDHFEAPGESAWLAATDLGEIRMAINLDGAGVVGHDTSVTPMACPDETARQVEAMVAERPGWTIGPEWYESDHAIFAMRGIPSLAITSQGAHDLANVLHAERDTTRMVDPGILAGVDGFIADWLAATRPGSPRP